MMTRRSSPQSPPSLTSKIVALNLPLYVMGFEYGCLTGCLTIIKACCQFLHGGVMTMIAEGVASLGTYITSGFRRIAGVQFSTNHIRATHLGELIKVEATPIQQGRNIQVWEVQLWKINPSASADKKMLLSTSRVTLLCNLPSSKKMKGFEDIVKKYAKL